MRYYVSLMKNNYVIWKTVFVASIIIFLLAQLVVNTAKTSASASKEVASQSPEIDWWPMFRHDSSHSGRSTSKAPNKNETLWMYETRHQIGSSAAVAEGAVFIGSYDHNLYALNATTGILIWKYDADGGIFSSPAVNNGKVFVSSPGKIQALNASNGNQIWSHDFWGNGPSSPTTASGRVFVGTDFEKVSALDENTGLEIWSFTTAGSVISSPAIAKDILYVGASGGSSWGNIYALNASTGTLIWNFKTGGKVNSSPCVAEGKVFIGSSDGNIYALNANTGALVWSFATSPHGVTSPVSSSPAFSEGKVFVGTFGSWPGQSWPWSFFALNASTGVPIWNYTTGAISYSSPAVADGKVFIMNYGGDIYALNVTTGAFIWSYSTGGSASWSSPTVADGRVYVGSGNGKVYSFGSMLYFNITVDPKFYDNRGEPLVPSPSSWTIIFPNGTGKAVSGSATFNGPMGTYSIGSVIWKGIPISIRSYPSIFIASNITWSAQIDCILPTNLSLSLSSSTSYVGFKVGIEANLTSNEKGVSDAGILLSYSVTGGKSWNDITFVETRVNGNLSAIWMPPATGNYIVKAIWSGNSTYPGTSATVSLAVIPFEEQSVFSVTSNSTISTLAFNSTSRELSFTVTGPSGTLGYVKVYIAKTLVQNIADVKVYLNGNQLDYTATSLDDSWLLYFTYQHSTHKVTITLARPSTSFIETPFGKAIIYIVPTAAVAILIALYALRKRPRARVSGNQEKRIKGKG